MRTDQPLRAILWPAFENRTGNPYNRLLATGLQDAGVRITEFTPVRLLTGRFDVWHMHWPEGILGKRAGLRSVPGRITLNTLLKYARITGTRTIWTVHNLEAHHRIHVADDDFWMAFTDKIDASIHLSKSGRSMAMSRFSALRGKPSFVIPHGHYRGIYPNTIGKAEARDRLGISNEGRVITHVGYGRPYKNIPHLIRSFLGLSSSTDRLVIAGRPSSKDIHDAILAASASDSRISLKLDFIPEEEMQVYLNAADLVVLPYTNILNSGSVLLALSFDRPVLVPNLGAMGELQAAIGANWVYTYDDNLTTHDLAGTLASISRSSPLGTAPLEHLDWNRLAAQTHEAYRSVCGIV